MSLGEVEMSDEAAPDAQAPRGPAAGWFIAGGLLSCVLLTILAFELRESQVEGLERRAETLLLEAETAVLEQDYEALSAKLEEFDGVARALEASASAFGGEGEEKPLAAERRRFESLRQTVADQMLSQRGELALGRLLDAIASEDAAAREAAEAELRAVVTEMRAAPAGRFDELVPLLERALERAQQAAASARDEADDEGEAAR